MASAIEQDPQHHTPKMPTRLKETIEHMREDVRKVDEPQFKAMFETAAEVLGGLVKTFQDYERKSESAMNERARVPGNQVPVVPPHR